MSAFGGPGRGVETAVRYNPPPNWPQPPSGWSPPPGWEPDPDWGPPPQGWSLWVPEDGPGAGGPGGGYQGGGYQGGGYQGGGYQGGGYQGGPAQGPPPSSSGSNTTKIVLALVGVVLLVVLVGGGLLLFLDRGDSSDQTTTAAGSSTTASGSAPRSASDGPPSCPSDGGSRSDPKALGAGGTVGDFCATIYRVVPDDTDAILGANSTNTPPTKGQYVLIDVAATNNGTSPAATSFELYVYLEGGDGVEYPDTDCDVVTEDDLSLEPEADPGQTAKGGFCLDVPAAALNGGVLRMESSASSAATYWKLD